MPSFVPNSRTKLFQSGVSAVLISRVLAAAFLSLVTLCAQAQESSWIRVFDVMWEAHWRQNGIMQSVVRWPIKEDRSLLFSVNSKASSSNAERAREAMGVVSRAAGLVSREVPEGSANVQVEFEIREFTQDELRQYSCFTQPSWKNSLFEKTRVVLSERYTYLCVYHELMHTFGLPGHPQGETVLSYFEGNGLTLKPIDLFMLAAWYSNDVGPGMYALASTRALNRRWINQYVADADKDQARAVEQSWFDKVIASLEAYAFGKGEPPTILYRSGRLNSEGMKRGLMYVQGTLGDAYLNGFLLARNTAKGSDLMLMSAKNGNVAASSYIARTLTSGKWPAPQTEPLCKWLKEAPLAESGLTEAELANTMASQACADSAVNR